VLYFLFDNDVDILSLYQDIAAISLKKRSRTIIQSTHRNRKYIFMINFINSITFFFSPQNPPSASPPPSPLQPLLDLLRRPRMLRIRPDQDIKHALLIPDVRELVTAHGYRHASCVHSGRSATVEDRDTADALYYRVDFGLD
jgi:hypothetical protein